MAIVESICGYLASFSIKRVKTGILVIYMEEGSSRNSAIIMKMFDKIISHSLITHDLVVIVANKLQS